MPGLNDDLESNRLNVAKYDIDNLLNYNHSIFGNVFLASIVFCDLRTIQDIIRALHTKRVSKKRYNQIEVKIINLKSCFYD